MGYYMPVILIVIGNVFYNIAAKSTSQDVNPFASLVVSYLTSAFGCLLLFFVTRMITGKNDHLFHEVRKVNWATFLLGISIIGAEAGALFLYKAGWKISVAQVLYSSLIAVSLMLVGYFIYREPITVTKLAGMIICLLGLYVFTR